MIKVEHINTWGFGHAIRGMRNPMNSWERSDSYETHIENPETLNTAPFQFFAGEADLDLMKRLYKCGTEHRKFMRQIFISMDIVAPLYWWKEFDTYKVGTVANSCSTMHKAAARDFVWEDFSTEKLNTAMAHQIFGYVIEALNNARANYIETQEKRHWDEMIQLLPTSYNQRRTITMSYENAAAMICHRAGHKLSEWREFVGILLDLPYMREILEGGNEA